MGMPAHHILLSSTYYDEVSLLDKAMGGASLVFLQPEKAIADDHCEYPKYERDRIREDLSVARQYGAKVAIQVWPRLKISTGDSLRAHYDGFVVHAPSPYMTKSGERAIELTKEEIKMMIQEAVKDAIAAKNFGFDMIQVRVGAESISAQFLSPAFNKRTDEYGGSRENRMRFSIEYIKAVREAVGPDFPIMFHVGETQFLPKSYDSEDVFALLEKVKDYVDMINAVAGGMDMIPGYFPEDKTFDPKKGFKAWYDANGVATSKFVSTKSLSLIFAAKVKARYPDKIVITNGSIMTPETAETAIAEGKVDGIMQGRALNADPFWPRKAMAGQREDIVPCLRCGYCYHTATNHTNTQCSVNPRYRRENRVPLELPKAKLKKKVVIVGAGPAGCKAALVAHERGHEVTLLEKTNEIGGQIRYGQYEKIKVDLVNYLNYLKAQIKKNKIDIRYNTKATPELIKELKPDVLFIAIGASPIRPVIKGSDGEHVHQALDIYPNLKSLGKEVAVIGGGLVGCELAYELLESGHDVTIVEMTDQLAVQGHFLYRMDLERALDRHAEHLTVLKNAVCREITEGKAIVEQGGEKKEIEGDDVVIAVGMKANKEEAFGFYGIADETFMIGDCEKVGKVLDATNDSFFIAANL
jgi:2,4-dienoyl-CoA reductase-like NADH-dependent reductase (Old Yellow Enzyme family)/thioredoxin reductase